MKIQSEFIESLNDNYAVFGDFVFCYESNIIIAKDEKADVLVDKEDQV